VNVPPGEGDLSPALTISNEFAEVVVRKMMTRNGERLLIEVPRSGSSIALCPVELEALTWQTPEVFSAMIARPGEPLTEEEEG
jgi:hypothetical protein